MKLSTRNIISVAILLATSLQVHGRPAIELKGVDKAVHVGQEKVNNKVREEFMGLQNQEKPIDITPYSPLFDLVCQSDLTDWCSIYTEQCSYVKTLCVRDENDNYCAFDIYEKYLKASNNNMNSIPSYIDLCDNCLIEMANEFQLVSQDEQAKYEMKTLSDMCKLKLFMDSYVEEEHQGDEEIISTLASLIPSMDKNKLKRHFGKIHSFKNPEVGGFVKSNGKIKYGHVGINEKVNTKIHNKNRGAMVHKREEEVTEGIEENQELIMVNSIKDKIVSALTDIKELALQKVSTIFTNLEDNVHDLLEDDLFINDPEATREKTVLTNNILSNIKDILNSDISDIEIEIGGMISEQTFEQEELFIIAAVPDDDEDTTNDIIEEEEVNEKEVLISSDEVTTVAEIPTVANVVEEEKEKEEEEINENDIFPTEEVFKEIVDYPVIRADEEIENENEIFQIYDEIKDEIDDMLEVAAIPTVTTTTEIDISSLKPTDVADIADAVVQEIYPEIPTDGYPIEDSGTEGDDEIDEILPDESSDLDELLSSEDDEDEEEDNDDNNNNNEFIEDGPHHGETPIVGPEIPTITPGKPQRPNKPWKFGWKVKPNDPHFHPGHRRPTVLQSINKLFEENKNQYTPSTPEEAASLYVPFKKWKMKKSEYVVSQELLNEDLDPEQGDIEEEEEEVQEVIDEGHSIKLNNPDNHRNNNEEEEVFEIGSKKVTFINSVHPTKPSLNFRNNNAKDTH